MPALRLIVAILLALLAQPVLAQGRDPAQCAATMDEYVQRLKLYATGVQEDIALLADAQRKGDTELTAHFTRLLETNRVMGVEDMLQRIEAEWAACGKAMFSAELIARVEAARPWATAATPANDVETPPRLAVADIVSTFVPFEPTDSGSCTGPYVDLAIKVVNNGGAFPRQVDLDLRRRTYTEASDEWAYFTVYLHFAYDNGETGQDQVGVFATDLGNGVLPAAGAVTVPLRVQVLDNRKHMTITGTLEGGSLAVADNDGLRAPPFTFEADIPIWDLYTENTATVSSLDKFAGDGSIMTAVRAVIVNRGGPTPGPVRGFFTVRQLSDGTTHADLDGKTFGPVGGGDSIIAGTKVRAPVKPPIEVESQLFALCPDGTPGMLADGNRADNYRVLQER